VYRNSLSLLLLAGVLLLQLTPPAHAHGTSQPVGHDPRPHLHISLILPSHGQGHPHSAAEGHWLPHHDDEIDGDDDRESVIARPDCPADPFSDHDADAVYTSGFETILTGRLQLADEVDATRSCVNPAMLGVAFSSPALCKRWVPSRPPFPDSSCPIYVRQLTLLI
jgi:hypothetical protein